MPGIVGLITEMPREQAEPQLLQMGIEDLTEPEDLPYLRNLIRQAAHTGEGFVIETRNVLPDGSRLWVRNNVSAITDRGGAVRHLMVVAEDVTDRRRAEEDLQRAHDELQETVEEREFVRVEATPNENLPAEVVAQVKTEARPQVPGHGHGRFPPAGAITCAACLRTCRTTSGWRWSRRRSARCPTAISVPSSANSIGTMA